MVRRTWISRRPPTPPILRAKSRSRCRTRLLISTAGRHLPPPAPGGTPVTFAPTASDSCVFSSLVYDDSENDLVTRFDPGTIEVGDEIILAGSARHLTKFILEYW